MSSTSTLVASKGTWLDGENESTPQGGGTTMKLGQQAVGLGAGERANGVLSFDVFGTLIDPTLISKATLKFTGTGISTMFGSTVRTLYAYRLDQDFTEAQCTWEISATGTNWTDSPVGSGAYEGAYYNAKITEHSESAYYKVSAPCSVGFRVVDATEFDVTELVKDAIRRRSSTVLIWIGIPLTDSVVTSGGATVCSPDHGTITSRPKIEIEVADKIVWDGSAGDGNVATASNWVLDTAPDYYDHAIFNDGSIDASTGTMSCNRMYVSENYTGQIGSSGSPIQIATIATAGYPLTPQITIKKNTGAFFIRYLTENEVRIHVANTPSADCLIQASGIYTDLVKLIVENTGGNLEIKNNCYPVIVKSQTGSTKCTTTGTSTDIVALGCKLKLSSGSNDCILAKGTRCLSTTGDYDFTIAGKSTVQYLGVELSDIIIYSGLLNFLDNENAEIETSGIELWGNANFDPRTFVGSWNPSDVISIKGSGAIFQVDNGRTATIA